MNDGDRSHSEQRWQAQKATEREREQHEIQPERPAEAHLREHPERGQEHGNDETEDASSIPIGQRERTRSRSISKSSKLNPGPTQQLTRLCSP